MNYASTILLPPLIYSLATTNTYTIFDYYCINACTVGSTLPDLVIVKQWVDINRSAPPSLFSHFDSISSIHFLLMGINIFGENQPWVIEMSYMARAILL